MKILGISGGTKNGANDCMCKEALLAAKEQGVDIEFVRLMDLDIKHCTGCKACVMSLFSGRGNMCVLKDDFQWLLDKMLDADGIIFSIPIFEKCAAGSWIVSDRVWAYPTISLQTRFQKQTAAHALIRNI